uniref:Uncharacterized protein n=1 Tax=biofilter metagenome TaxID=1070537 RepID=A0A1A7GE72_9ZZZZ
MTLKKSQDSTVMDFSHFLLSETGSVEINLPNGEPMKVDGKRVIVHVFGPASAEHARASAAMQRAAREQLFAKKGKTDVDQAHESDVRYLLAITAGIENFPYPGGTDAIYRERRLVYIADQVRAFVGDQGNFFKPAAKS